MKPTTIVGRVKYSGEGNFDGDLYDYGPLEIETDDGLVELPKVMVHKTVQRALAAGNTAAISLTETTNQGKPVAMIWGAHDYQAQRTFFHEEMIKVRGAFAAQIYVISVMAMFGLLFFIVPGLILGWKAFEAVKKAKTMPTEDEMREHVQSLAKMPKPVLSRNEVLAA